MCPRKVTWRGARPTIGSQELRVSGEGFAFPSCDLRDGAGVIAVPPSICDSIRKQHCGREDEPFFVKSKAKQTTTKITMSVTCTWAASKGGMVVICCDSGKLASGQTEDATDCICFCLGFFQEPPNPSFLQWDFLKGLRGGHSTWFCL